MLIKRAAVIMLVFLIVAGGLSCATSPPPETPPITVTPPSPDIPSPDIPSPDTPSADYPDIFISSIEERDKKTSLEEADSILGTSVPVPTYFPLDYEVKEVYIYAEEGHSSIITLIISDEEIEWEGNEFQCKMKMRIVYPMLGGLKMFWAEAVSYGEFSGRLETENDHYVLWWNLEDIDPKGGEFQITLVTTKRISREQLLKTAASVRQ